ncbi:ribonucleotide reductase inhibitor-domain-containing protein [Stachybotrys elegans]|uniref:Ribonucleotide reductase inhibitor-domain-containing protein n=1 Tax=Stachybotrys elegans TaxID=80388 RepID=A0A8K0WRL9_9HYPO|nr:ribonucleotide reductase inhibitor-domain-containing protein [Stachybotrys elegans]
MSAPRTKRQFAGAAADPSQRQITSFFSPRSANATPPETNALRQPSLPSSVQSNLLSVGMRVRKSVPEGYKTSSPTAFKLWTDTSIPSNTKPVPMGPTPRELLPFCGINKVGGLDTQPEFSLDYDDVPPLDCVPELTMSQESTDANEVMEPSRKRIFDEDDGDMAPVAVLGLSDGEMGSHSVAQTSWGNARRMAVPRSRMRKHVSFKDLDQENMAVDEDFDEADFLVYGEGKQMDTSA